MDPVTGALALKAFQGVTSLVQSAISGEEETQQPEKQEKTTDFEGLLRNLIAPNGQNQTNEEELFSAVVHERIVALKGEEAGAEYQNSLNDYKAQYRRGDGYVPVEKATNSALDQMVSNGMLTQEEADTIYSQSFAASQLDDNKQALFDGRGDPSDNTVATASMEEALAAARAMIEKFDAGEEVPDNKTSSATSGAASGAETTGKVNNVNPEGNSVDGPNGFVFKPESDHERKLVVLTPKAMAYDILSVVLKDQEGNVIEKGESSGYANGGREHWRFDRAGSDYEKDITVEVKRKDGSIIKYQIDDPSQRYD